MGDHKVISTENISARNKFMRQLLNDIESLEYMLKHKLIEDDKIRIGAEQEFFLVNEQWRPYFEYEYILKALDDPHFTTEMTRYTLEINADPIEAKDNCLTKMHEQLKDLLYKANNVAGQYKAKVILTGILPTIRMNEITLEQMTPIMRYYALNERTKELRGEDFSLHIKGVDELTVLHDTIVFEGCNASFQTHLQIAPDDFISSYNWAQTIAAPVLAISANSPLLMGRELWNETRIALFQQSIDTRATSYALHEKESRISFGHKWASGSVVDIFKDDIARHKVMLAKAIKNNSINILERGGVPKLEALKVHNSTIYHWNRACYGLSDEKPHLRIENRYLPAGPSTDDEIANLAFWVGLMAGRPSKFDDMPSIMDFKDVKANFWKAARYGKDSVISWENKDIQVNELILEKLIPIALYGLQKLDIDEADIQKYINIIKNRVNGQNGVQWQISNFRRLRQQYKLDDSLKTLTSSIYQNQQKNIPIHKWQPINEICCTHKNAITVGSIMSTKLFLVEDTDLADLATNIMRWNNIHHLPVENSSGQLVGLLTWSHMTKRYPKKRNEKEIVSDIMVTEPFTVHSDTSIKEAMNIMKKNGYGCLPVVEKDKLVGIITNTDLIPFSNDKHF